MLPSDFMQKEIDLDSSKIIEGFWRKTLSSSIFSNIATVLSILIPALIAIILWFNNKIDKVVEQRVEPYENYQLGSILSADEEFDLAIPVLGKAFDTMTKKDESEEKIIPFLDSYLHAIVNSKNPLTHRSKFAKIEKFIKDFKISPNAFHYKEMGWYYLRIGDINKARENLQQSIMQYKNESLYRPMAEAQWAISLSFIAEENIDEAIIYAKEAAKHNPREYDMATLLLDKEAMKDDAWIKHLTNTFDKFNSSLNSFFERLSMLNQEKNNKK